MASPDGPPPPVTNPITGTWRNSFADKDQTGRALQKFDRVEELVCDQTNSSFDTPLGLYWYTQCTTCDKGYEFARHQYVFHTLKIVQKSHIPLIFCAANLKSLIKNCCFDLLA
jgi:hypothetical protein